MGTSGRAYSRFCRPVNPRSMDLWHEVRVGFGQDAGPRSAQADACPAWERFPSEAAGDNSGAGTKRGNTGTAGNGRGSASGLPVAAAASLVPGQDLAYFATMVSGSQSAIIGKATSSAMRMMSVRMKGMTPP